MFWVHAKFVTLGAREFCVHPDVLSPRTVSDIFSFYPVYRLSHCLSGSIMLIMTGQRRRYLAVPLPICRTILALAALASILLLAGCGKRPRPAIVPPPTPPKTKSGVDITDARIAFPMTGPHVWEAEVGKITATGDPGKMKLTDVKCKLYRQGQEVMSVQADGGDAVQQEKTIFVRLTGNVLATEPKRGLRLKAEKFEWSSQYDRVSATNVQWLGMGYVHRADRGTFTTDLTRATFNGHVETKTAGQP